METEAIKPFQFYTRLSLREATGLRAVTLSQLLKFIRTVPGSVIYHHTHHYLQQHQYLTPEPPNDFAYWVTEVLGEGKLGEQLASIDTIQFQSIRALRERIAEVIEEHLKGRPLLRMRAADPEEAFHFVKAVSVVVPTPYQASNLGEFAECLKAVTVDSIYFHIFEARIRLQRGSNDFSLWLESVGEKICAQAVASLDPYTHTMEELRQAILRLLSDRLSVKERART